MAAELRKAVGECSSIRLDDGSAANTRIHDQSVSEVRLDEASDDAALSAGQQVEERLGSVDYDVWACPTCDERLVLAYGRWWSSIKGCPRRLLDTFANSKCRQSDRRRAWRGTARG